MAGRTSSWSLRSVCAGVGLLVVLLGAPAAAEGSCSLHRGAHGSGVKALQRALGVPIDGRFGPRTARALRRFQSRHGLVVTGCANGGTRAALGLVGGTSAAVQLTLEGARLEALQRALGVTADGEMGPQTRRAIRLAQGKLGLAVDGRPSVQLLSALGLVVGRESPGAPSALAARMVVTAQSKLGDPYERGATGPDSFDCSGLVQLAARSAAVPVPRTSFEQFEAGAPVDPTAIVAGDLVFFNTAGPGASHVGIALDGTHAVSATSHGVRKHEIFDEYWGAHYVGARRLG